MSNYYVQTKWVNLGLMTDAPAAALVYPVGSPEDLLEIVIVTTAAMTVANDVVTIAVRNVDDSSSVTKGSFTVPFAGSALNKVLDINLTNIITSSVASDGSTVYTGSEGVVKINPGQELVLSNTGAQTLGSYQVYGKFAQQDFAGDRVTGAQSLTFTAV